MKDGIWVRKRVRLGRRGSVLSVADTQLYITSRFDVCRYHYPFIDVAKLLTVINDDNNLLLEMKGT